MCLNTLSNDSLTLPIATNAQEEIVGAALSILRAKYPKPMADSRPDRSDMSFHFKKAGVILWQISPDNPRQQDLFDPIDRSKQKALMEPSMPSTERTDTAPSVKPYRETVADST